MVRNEWFRILLLILVSICLLAVTSCTKEQPGKQRGGERQETADTKASRGNSDVVLVGFDGNTTRLSEFRERVVVLSFWATWNNDSRELIKIMNTLQRQFRDKVVILGVAMDDTGEQVVRRFVNEHQIQYPVFINGKQAARSFGGVGKLPTTLIFRQNGQLYERIKGLRKRTHYEKRIIGLYTRRL